VNALIVYESHWGNTAAIARAIAEGIGPGARALPTSEATPALIASADLLVAGAPVLGFRLPTESMRQGLSAESRKAPSPADLSHPSLRSWLGGLSTGHARSAVFETGLWWSPGSATKAIAQGLEGAGYPGLAKPRRFVVKGRYGPLRDGELERARAWGAELAALLRQP